GQALALLAARAGRLGSVAHGTTVVTNAIVERRGARVGLVTTRGFRDVLEIGRQNRAHLYRLDLPPKPEPLVSRRLRLEVSERVAADGRVMVPLALEEVSGIVEALAREGVESVAVSLLHAYANPVHEQALQTALRARFPYVCISTDINAEFREYERTSTTVVNASVMPMAARYLGELRSSLVASGIPVHILHSAGGMMSIEAARARPLAMAMSGPAAGVAAAAWVARRLGIRRAIAFDMGGTTTDVCLIADGRPDTIAQRHLGDVPIRLPMVAVESIGAGGGSVAAVDATGALKVGPRSAGALPGPAAYDRGGTEPTVTDANLLLGYLNSEGVYGGAIRLQPERAETALARLGRAYGLSPVEAALGVIEIANASMLRALRLVSVQRGYDLRQFVLIAYGGAGPVHAGALARSAGIRTIVVPALSGAFSALGCLVSPLRYDAVQTYQASLEAWNQKPVDEGLRALEARCVAPLLEEGIAPEAVGVSRSVDLRYVGQNYELDIPYQRDPARLRAAFEERHRRLYGYATGESVECVNLRVVASVASHPEELPAFVSDGGATTPTGWQRAYFPPAGAVRLPRYDRTRLPVGHAIAGPALIEDESSTTVLGPGQQGRTDRLGNLIIEEQG
ncbi:MAG: hydantoinase/oxoprolinase family protein, partial [Candidatus Rokuibacteriota bacterium]